MYLGYTGGVANLLVHEGMNYTVHFKYTAGAVANLVVTYGLKRNSTLETQYPAASQTVLSAGQAVTDIFWWSEDGVNQVVLADNAQTGTSHTGTIYTVGFEALSRQRCRNKHCKQLYRSWYMECFAFGRRHQV